MQHLWLSHTPLEIKVGLDPSAD